MSETALITFNSRVTGWVRFFEENPPYGGTSDLLCVGPHHSIDVASGFAATMAGLSPQGRPLYIDILIVFPKSSTDFGAQDETASFYSHVVEKIDEYVGETGAVPPSPEFLTELKQRLKVKACPDNDSGSVIEILKSIHRPTAILLADADHFATDAEITPFHLTESTPVHLEQRIWLMEDVWVTNLLTLANACQQIISNKQIHLVLLTQQYGPESTANNELLQSISNCSLLWKEAPEDFTSLRGNAKHWLELASEQRLNEALAEIENSDLAPINKALITAQCLNAASHPVWGFQVISPYISQIKDSEDADLITQVSKVAAAAGEYDLALEMLQTALARNINTDFGLRLSLRVAQSITAKQEEQEILRRFSELYPYSPESMSDAFQACDSQADFVRLRDNLATRIQSGKADLVANFYFTLAQHFASASSPDFLKIIGEIKTSETLRDFTSAAVLSCARYAEKIKRIDIALQLYLTHEWRKSFEETVAWRLLSIVEDLFIAENTLNNGEDKNRQQPDRQDFEEDDITKSLIYILNYLSRNPFNGQLRAGLYRALSPEISGMKGSSYIALITIRAQPPAIISPVKDKPTVEPVPSADLPEIFEALVSQLQSPLTLGLGRLPQIESSYSLEQILRSLTLLMEVLVLEGVRGDEDQHYLRLLLHLIILICRELGEENESTFISVAGAGLASSGLYQQARDLAEQCLMLATKPLSKSHLRLAWESYADIYQRCHNPLEAIIGLACAQQITDATLTPDQIFLEQLLTVRLLRDFELFPIALKHMEKLLDSIPDVSNPDRARRQLDVMGLGIMLQFLLNARDVIPRDQRVEELKQAAEALITLQRSAVEESEEILPTAILLAQINNQLIEEGEERSEIIDIELALCFQFLSPESVTFLQAFADPALSLTAIRNLNRAIGNPRFLEDLSMDRYWIVQLAMRALSNPEVIKEPRQCLYLLECMANLSINTEASHSLLRSSKADVISEALRKFTTAALHRKDFHLNPSEVSRLRGLDSSVDINVQHPTLNKPAEADELVAFSQELNAKGIELYALGLAGNNMLIKFVAEGGTLSSAREKHEIFDAESFYQWRLKYPYAYKEMPTDDPFGINSVEGTLHHIGIEAPTTELPCLLITDTSLQHIPPNLLLINNQLAGLTKPIARAPSISWLIKTHSEAVTWSGRRSAWIPKSNRTSDILTRLFEDLSDTLSDNDFTKKVLNAPLLAAGMAEPSCGRVRCPRAR